MEVTAEMALVTIENEVYYTALVVAIARKYGIATDEANSWLLLRLCWLEGSAGGPHDGARH